MTRVEYLATLALRSQWMGSVIQIPLDATLSGNGQLKAYEVLMLVKLANDTFQSVKQPFYVLGEDTAEETVYPINQERSDAVVNEFKNELRTYIDTNIINEATIPRVTIDSLNEDQDFAICTAYMEDAETHVISTGKYFVFRNAAEGITIKEYVG